MEGIGFGQYLPGNSFLHRLDPRTKLIISAELLWLVFLLKNPLALTGFGGSLLFLYFLSGVTAGFWQACRPGLYIILITLLVNMFFTPGETIFKLGSAVVSREGFIQGLTIGLKVFVFISLSSLVALTTSPVRMTDGLELMMRPLQKAGFPGRELAMMMNIALRFIPTFGEEIDQIVKAQVARGADFASRHPGRRIKYLTALLVPLFIGAFRRADELSVAMESRGYTAGMKRTSLHELNFILQDYLVLISGFVVAAAFIINRYFV